MCRSSHSTCARALCRLFLRVTPGLKGSPLMVPSTTRVGQKNRCAISCWPASRMWIAATRLSERHLKTLLAGRIAAITSGGLNEACEIHVSVAAPCSTPCDEVITYMPFDIRRNARLRTAGSMASVPGGDAHDPQAPGQGAVANAGVDEIGNALDRSKRRDVEIVHRGGDAELALEPE